MFSQLNIEIENDLEPAEFHLSSNFPNPFRDKTTIKYCIAYQTMVQLTVYDLEGKVIEKLVDEEKNPGTYEVEFSTSVELNLPDGCYYYRLEAGEYKSENKILIIHK